jgi:hypothetical protein
MSKHVFKIEDGRFGLTLTDPDVTDACAATIADFDAFTCQITNGALTASPNVTQETIPATWCDPEENVPQVAATSYSLEISYLQDPDLVDGLSRFLFEHDADLAWFFMGLSGDNPPKAVGQVRLTSGQIGGEGRITLTADATLPCDGKPVVCFGDATTSESVGGGTGLDATGATAGSPGTFTPPGADPPANLATLNAAGVTASPAGAWSTGQHVVLGDATHAHWDGTAPWVTGNAP